EYYFSSELNIILRISIIFTFKNILINGQIFVSDLSEPNAVTYLPLESRDSSGHHKSSECALILQRTYVNGKRYKSHAPLYGGFFDMIKGEGNEVDDGDYGDNQYQEVCIRYIDVNRAVKEAMHTLRYKRPNGIDSLEPPPDMIGETSEVALETTRLLTYQFELSHDEILNGLPLIDMSRTVYWDHCPMHVKPIPCSVDRYRTYTAHCNNLKNPSWGASHTPFVRYLPPVYSDGIQGERVSVVKGAKLPNPRLVTSIVHRDFDHPSNELTILIMSWGQFIDHDVALAAPPRSKYIPAMLNELMPISYNANL
ncbi:unnamed protein product, partial [Medioppia subpectinata]